MARPLRWARDLHPIRERVTRSRTETWSRKDVEVLFGVSRVTAQTIMKAVGDRETVAKAHFIERSSLLEFLNEMIAAPSPEQAMRQRLETAAPAPKPKPLRVSIPQDLRHSMLPDLPPNITLEPGRLEIRAPTALSMTESLAYLALIMQNDLDRVRAVLEQGLPTEETEQDGGLGFLS